MKLRGWTTETGEDQPGRTPNPAAPSETLRVDPTPRSDCNPNPEAVRTGVLAGWDDHLAIYEDSAQHAADPVSPGAVTRLLEYHDAYVRETLEAYWGRPSDLDGNGRTIVFVTPAVPSTVSAFVSATDLVRKDVCAASNEMEIVYFNPELLYGMEHPTEPSWDALETLAHELKHVISLRHRIIRSEQTGSNAFHPLWVEEGTAEVAAQISSRVAWAANGGPPVGSRVTGEDLLETYESAGEITPEMWGVVVRLLRTRQHFRSQPNSITGAANGAGPGHNSYSGGWAFHNWLADAYGGAAAPFADTTLFRALSDSTAPAGIPGITAATGRSFPELFEEFAIAVGMAGEGIPQPPFGFTTMDFPSATAVVPPQSPPDPGDGPYPWPVNWAADSSGEEWGTGFWFGPIGTGGLRFHDFVSSGTGDLEVELTLPLPARMIVLRLR